MQKLSEIKIEKYLFGLILGLLVGAWQVSGQKDEIISIYETQKPAQQVQANRPDYPDLPIVTPHIKG